MLLILDSMDDLLPGRAAVTDLPSHAPHVRVVATSRAPLHILGERVLPMDGPTLPADEADLESAAASALFLDEARRVDVGYQVCREDRPATCRCAAVLTCPQTLAEFSKRIDVLATDEPDLPERQRSLACVLESTLAGLQSSDRADTQIGARCARSLRASSWCNARVTNTRQEPARASARLVRFCPGQRSVAPTPAALCSPRKLLVSEC